MSLLLSVLLSHLFAKGDFFEVDSKGHVKNAEIFVSPDDNFSAIITAATGMNTIHVSSGLETTEYNCYPIDFNSTRTTVVIAEGSGTTTLKTVYSNSDIFYFSAGSSALDLRKFTITNNGTQNQFLVVMNSTNAQAAFRECIFSSGTAVHQCVMYVNKAANLSLYGCSYSSRTLTNPDIIHTFIYYSWANALSLTLDHCDFKQLTIKSSLPIIFAHDNTNTSSTTVTISISYCIFDTIVKTGTTSDDVSALISFPTNKTTNSFYVSNCRFTNINHSAFGVIGYQSYRCGTMLFNDSLFEDINTTHHGAGIWLVNHQNTYIPTVTITYCKFQRCTCTQGTGGAIFISTLYPTITYCRFYSCVNEIGGAIFLNMSSFSPSTVQLNNNDFANNTAKTGGSLGTYNANNFTFNNNKLRCNTATETVTAADETGQDGSDVYLQANVNNVNFTSSCSNSANFKVVDFRTVYESATKGLGNVCSQQNCEARRYDQFNATWRCNVPFETLQCYSTEEHTCIVTCPTQTSTANGTTGHCDRPCPARIPDSAWPRPCRDACYVQPNNTCNTACPIHFTADNTGICIPQPCLSRIPGTGHICRSLDDTIAEKLHCGYYTEGTFAGCVPCPTAHYTSSPDDGVCVPKVPCSIRSSNTTATTVCGAGCVLFNGTCDNACPAFYIDNSNGICTIQACLSRVPGSDHKCRSEDDITAVQLSCGYYAEGSFAGCVPCPPAHYDSSPDGVCTLRALCSSRSINNTATLWCGTDCVLVNESCGSSCSTFYTPDTHGVCTAEACLARIPDLDHNCRSVDDAFSIEKLRCGYYEEGAFAGCVPCPSHHFFSDNGMCSLLACPLRTHNTSSTYACGSANCLLRPGGDPVCGAECPPFHAAFYKEDTRGICILQDCNDRIPINGRCAAYALDTCSLQPDGSTCNDSCPDFYEPIDGICVEINCSLRTPSGFPASCGLGECFLQSEGTACGQTCPAFCGPGNTPIPCMDRVTEDGHCRSSADQSAQELLCGYYTDEIFSGCIFCPSAHYTSNPDGVCVLKDRCADRTANETATTICGPSCYQQPLESPGHFQCTAECSTHFTVGNKGMCVSVDCLQRNAGPSKKCRSLDDAFSNEKLRCGYYEEGAFAGCVPCPSAHYASSVDGVCILKATCTARSNNATAARPCGMGCVLLANETCALECPELTSTDGKCISKNTDNNNNTNINSSNSDNNSNDSNANGSKDDNDNDDGDKPNNSKNNKPVKAGFSFVVIVIIAAIAAILIAASVVAVVCLIRYKKKKLGGGERGENNRKDKKSEEREYENNEESSKAVRMTSMSSTSTLASSSSSSSLSSSSSSSSSSPSSSSLTPLFTLNQTTLAAGVENDPPTLPSRPPGSSTKIPPSTSSGDRLCTTGPLFLKPSSSSSSPSPFNTTQPLSRFNATRPLVPFDPHGTGREAVVLYSEGSFGDSNNNDTNTTISSESGITRTSRILFDSSSPANTTELQQAQAQAIEEAIQAEVQRRLREEKKGGAPSDGNEEAMREKIADTEAINKRLAEQNINEVLTPYDLKDNFEMDIKEEG